MLTWRKKSPWKEFWNLKIAFISPLHLRTVEGSQGEFPLAQFLIRKWDCWCGYLNELCHTVLNWAGLLKLKVFSQEFKWFLLGWSQGEGRHSKLKSSLIPKGSSFQKGHLVMRVLPPHVKTCGISKVITHSLTPKTCSQLGRDLYLGVIPDWFSLSDNPFSEIQNTSLAEPLWPSYPPPTIKCRTYNQVNYIGY